MKKIVEPERIETTSGEFDCQWNTVQSPANSHDCGRGMLGYDKRIVSGSRPLDEKIGCSKVSNVLFGDLIVLGGQHERTQSMYAFAFGSQRFTARCKYSNVRAGAQYCLSCHRGCLQKMLATIENDEACRVAERRIQPVLQVFSDQLYAHCFAGMGLKRPRLLNVVAVHQPYSAWTSPLYLLRKFVRAV